MNDQELRKELDVKKNSCVYKDVDIDHRLLVDTVIWDYIFNDNKSYRFYMQ